MGCVDYGTRFTVLEDFYSRPMESHYVKGRSYTVRQGDFKLADIVPVWVREGKVKIDTGGDGA